MLATTITTQVRRKKYGQGANSQCGTVCVIQIHSKTTVEQREVRNVHVCDNLWVIEHAAASNRQQLNMGGWQQLNMWVMKLTEWVQRLRQSQWHAKSLSKVGA